MQPDPSGAEMIHRKLSQPAAVAERQRLLVVQVGSGTLAIEYLIDQRQ